MPQPAPESNRSILQIRTSPPSLSKEEGNPYSTIARLAISKYRDRELLINACASILKPLKEGPVPIATLQDVLQCTSTEATILVGEVREKFPQLVVE